MTKHFVLALLLLFLMCDYSFAQQTVPRNNLITLERNPGFWGTDYPCPYYKLTVFADGNLELEPKSYNKEYKLVAGEIIKSRISLEQVKQLVAEFEKVDFQTLKSTFEEGKLNGEGDCPEYWTDSATVITSITIGSNKNKAEHYHGCRGTESLSKLTNLENRIDEIVNTKQIFDCFFKRSK